MQRLSQVMLSDAEANGCCLPKEPICSFFKDQVNPLVLSNRVFPSRTQPEMLVPMVMASFRQWQTHWPQPTRAMAKIICAPAGAHPRRGAKSQPGPGRCAPR